MKITGLDQLQKTLADAQKAAKALDGDLLSVTFQPDDPASIDRALRQVDQAVDRRLGRWRGNPIVDDMAKKAKANFKTGIKKQARAARDG